MSRPPKGAKEALAAISSLKRALGIAHHPLQPDCLTDQTCRIYTSDAQSAELLGELVYKAMLGPRNGAYYDSQPTIKTLRDTVKVTQLGEAGFEVTVGVPKPHEGIFASKINRLTAKHISADKRLGPHR